MKISQNKVDDLNLEVSMAIVADDYADSRKKKLNEYRRKAEIKGFRKGMVPASLIERMYGHQALYEAVNDVIAEGLNSFISENKLNVIGEPLPSEEKEENVWENGRDFNFKFDIALKPALDFGVDSKDEVVYYNITISDAARKEMKDNLLRQYGNLEETESVVDGAFIVADLEQGENKILDTYIAMRNVADEARSAFLGRKAGDSFDIDVNLAFTDETDRAALLKVKKEELPSVEPMWKVTVKSIRTFVPAKLEQATYDKLFGEGVVKDEAGFDAKIDERLKYEYTQEADYRFSKDLREYLVKKSGIALPEAFLKRWLTIANEGKFTAEDIEKDFASFIDGYKWQLVRDYLTEKLSVKIGNDDVLASAKGYAAYQYSMYGMYDVPQEQISAFAEKLLQDEEQSRRIIETVETEKVVSAVRAVITLKNKKISVEKFRELK